MIFLNRQIYNGAALNTLFVEALFNVPGLHTINNTPNDTPNKIAICWGRLSENPGNGVVGS